MALPSSRSLRPRIEIGPAALSGSIRWTVRPSCANATVPRTWGVIVRNADSGVSQGPLGPCSSRSAQYSNDRPASADTTEGVRSTNRDPPDRHASAQSPRASASPATRDEITWLRMRPSGPSNDTPGQASRGVQRPPLAHHSARSSSIALDGGSVLRRRGCPWGSARRCCVGWSRPADGLARVEPAPVDGFGPSLRRAPQ
jgi:hypothetical protein